MLERNRARLPQDPEYATALTVPAVTTAQPATASSPLPGGRTAPPVGGNQQYAAGGRVPPTGGNQQYEGGGRVPPVGGNQPYEGGGRVPPTGGNQPYENGGSSWTQPPPPVPPTTRPPAIEQQRAPTGGFSPANVVTDTMSQLLDPNGTYIRNARQRGIEMAAASGNRAGSSIAGGSAARAAIEAAQPLLAQAMGLQGQRENLAFQGEQNALERNRDYTQAQLQDWINSRSFNRDFYGALTMMPINSAYQLNSMIQSYALENPDVYTADVISGMSNFFTQNLGQLLSTYFPGLYGGGNRTNVGGGG